MYKKFLLIGSGNFVNEIKPALSGLALEIEIANTLQEINPKLRRKGIDLAILDNDSVKNALPILQRSKINFAVLSSKRSIRAISRAKAFGAYSSIINSDFVIIGPGDLFTSIITNLLIKDIRKAVKETKAKKIYICNLMTKPGETSNFDALDHIREILKYLKGDCLDYIVISDNNRLSMDSVLRYSKKKQFPVKIGSISAIKKITKAKIVVADVAHEKELIRHDSEKLQDVIFRIINEKG